MRTGRGKVRSIITRVLVFLLLGAVVNVALALGCAIRPFPENATHFHYVGTWGLDVHVAPGEVHVGEISRFRSLVNGRGRSQAQLEDIIPTASLFNEPRTTDSLHLCHTEHFFGWPLLSLHYRESFPRPVTRLEPAAVAPAAARGLLQLGSPAQSWGDIRRDLPLLPTWPGFAINTLFYAAILWGLFAAPGMIRRRVRIRRGRCPACGYIIAPGTASGGVCSECGAEGAT